MLLGVSRSIEKIGMSENDWKNDDFLAFGPSGDDNANTDDGGRDADADAAPTKKQKRPAPTGSSSGSFGPNRTTTANADLPPWMDERLSWQQNLRNNRRPAPLVSLHNEIVEFAKLMEPRQDEIRQREELVRKVTRLAEQTFGGRERCTVKVFGSQATGLFLPSSDIDLVLLIIPEENNKAAAGASGNNGKEGGGAAAGTSSKQDDAESQKEREKREMEEWDATTASSSSRSPLVVLGEALRKHWIDDLSYLEIIENTRIPIVKFTHAPTNLSVDICLNQETGTKAAELVRRFGDAMPPLRPLTFVLKYFMAARGLNEPYTGGVGSFLLQMMIVSFLQHREREEFHASGSESILNLGALLLEFFELYGIDFNYVTTGISIRNDGSYFPKGAKNRRENYWQPARPFSLALENPFETDMDVGKSSFRIQLVQRSFEVAFRVLMSHVSEPALPPKAGSILASILLPTDEMRTRAVHQSGASKSDSSGYRNKKDEVEVIGSSGSSDMDTSSSSGAGDEPKYKKQRK